MGCDLTHLMRMRNTHNGSSDSGPENTAPPWLNHWGIALGLASTYLEPMIPIPHRAGLLEEWNGAWEVDPDWARTTIAGVLCNLIASLAPEDPWLQASGRYGVLRIGTRRMGRTGAVLPDGEPLAGWRACIDLLGMPRHDLTTDPCYLPAAWHIRNAESAFLLAWARNGWLETKAALCAMDSERARVVAKEAVHWAIFRRRCYGVPADDGWTRVQFSKWALRAYHYEISGNGFEEDEIEQDVAEGRLPWPPNDPADPIHWDTGEDDQDIAAS